METRTLSVRPSMKKTAGVIDADVHNYLRTHDQLKQFMPARFHRAYEQERNRYPHLAYWHGWSLGAGGRRIDSTPPSGGPPGSDLDFLREQLLDPWDLGYAILNPIEHFFWTSFGETGLAYARGLNEFNVQEWLDKEPRMRCGISVPFEDGDLAAAEIHRVADDPRFVLILMPSMTRDAMGHQRYWKILEAASDRNLPIAIHVAGNSGIPNTGGAGWPSYFVEFHVGWMYAYQAHVISLLRNGAFDRFPNLQIVLTEPGLAWMPPLMWRLDRSWRMSPEDWPHLRYEPSRYIREHCWFTTQPIDEADTPAQFMQMIRQLDMDGRIVFASDYPHWDFDAPDLALPRSVPDELQRKILQHNGRALFHLPPLP